MCLISFAYNMHPRYSLVLLANRDEFYKRPARKAQFWTEEGFPDILAGKDLSAGGTWMGINKNGKWAALTNYRDMSKLKPNPPSRGHLVLNYLKSGLTAVEYLESIKEKASLYDGFNLLAGDNNGIFHFSNETNKITRIKPGVHGLSNALLNTPWPKLETANSKLAYSIQEDNLNRDTLFNILTDQQKADESQLPETGLTKEMEKAVSSIFISTDDYGTRCSSLLFIDMEGNIDFTERSYIPGPNDMEEVRFAF
ncbi:MAG: NRDE family protein [Bacteroidales bacterium]|nr:NRDE family protein [Bacteroidales bacterium]